MTTELETVTELTTLVPLTPMAKLLSKAGAWIRFSLAKNKLGNDVFAGSDDAVSFCLLGAGDRCYGYKQFRLGGLAEKLYQAILEIAPETPGCPSLYSNSDPSIHKQWVIANWNNHINRTQEEIVDLCIKAGV